MEAKLKELIKEAVLEALSEMYAANAETADYVLGETVTDKNPDKKPGRPGPVIGPVGFSL